MEEISCTKYYEADICTNEQCVFKNCCYYYLIGKKEVTYSSNTTGYETIKDKDNGIEYDEEDIIIWGIFNGYLEECVE